MVAKGEFSRHQLCLVSIFTLIAIFPFLSFAHSTPSSTSSRYLSATQPQHQGSEHIHKKRTELVGPENCHGFVGDQDTYGLGIRIGVYLQWVITVIAYLFVRSEAETVRAVNNCFQAAMFGGLVFLTITKGPDMIVVEPYIMLLFCLGVMVPMPMRLHNKDRMRMFCDWLFGYSTLDSSTLGLYFRIILNTAWASYGVWYAFVGMDGMMLSPVSSQKGCLVNSYCTSSVDLSGSPRTILKVVFVVCLICSSVALVLGTHLLIIKSFSYIFKGGWKRKDSIDRDDVSDVTLGTASTPFPAHPGPESHHNNRVFVVIVFSVVSCLTVYAIETTIKCNKIEDVGDIGSTGQILPLIIGFGGMAHILMIWIQGLIKQIATREGLQNGALRGSWPTLQIVDGDTSTTRSCVNSRGNGVPLQQINSSATALPPSGNAPLPPNAGEPGCSSNV